MTKAPNPQGAVDDIIKVLINEGREWTSETIEWVAEALAHNGYERVWEQTLGKFINLDDEALFTAIWGSGASSYSWYFSTKLNEAAMTYTVTMESDAVEDLGVTVVLTPDVIRQTIVKILDEKPEYTGAVQHIDWSDPECDSDVDADVADVILQTAILGKVVYG